MPPDLVRDRSGVLKRAARQALKVLLTTVLVSIVSACAGTVVGGGADVLRVLETASGTYVCAGGERFVATYYRLSDDSLQFAKVIFPGGKETTLPLALSASGARYTDEREHVWWTKGDTAWVQGRGADGAWRVIATDCRKSEAR